MFRRIDWLWCLMILGVLVAGIAGACAPAGPSRGRQSVFRENQREGFSSIDKSFSIDLSAVKTYGNHSYAPVNTGGVPAEYTLAILLFLAEFERAHPELEVTGWQTENNPAGYGNHGYFYGLWVDHRPRAQK